MGFSHVGVTAVLHWRL